MKYYIFENGYWEVEDRVSVPEGATVVPRRPSLDYDWDSQASEWKMNSTRGKRASFSPIERELSRLVKFNFLPTEIYDSISSDLISYREDLRNYVKGWKADSIQPPCPASLTDENFYNL